LLEETDSGVFLLSSKIWLLVDFFCSAEFWSVASATLSKSSVLVIRQSQISLEGVESISACDKRLAALGFIRAADLESNHPQVIHGVYLRNLSTEVQQALSLSNQEAKAKNELALKLEEESKGRAALVQEKATLVQDKAALEKEKARLIQEAAEFEQQKAKLTKETMALKVSLETQAKEFSATQLRCQELESINQNLENRQQLLHEELVKAEAQIELIKDLLLRESGI